MNEIFKDTVTIHASKEQVWRYFTNLEENGPDWMNGITSLENASSEELKEGTRYVFLARGKKHTTTITEFEPMKKVTMTSIQGKFRADYTYLFTGSDENTEVILVAKCEASGFSKILSPVIKIAIRKSDGGQLENFKKAFEKDAMNR